MQLSSVWRYRPSRQEAMFRNQKKSLDTREALITQREAAGITKHAARTVESMYAVPPAVWNS